MPVSSDPRRLEVALLAVPEASAAVVYGLHEVFACVGTMWETLTGERTQSRRMVPRIVAQTAGPMRTAMGATIVADTAFGDQVRSDVIIVSDLALPPDANLAELWPREIAWLRTQYEAGAIVCSVCTGSLLLAEAGFLDGREATTHWSARLQFAQRYPSVKLQPQRVLAPSGPEHDIVTSGGSASWTDLALYLIARFCGSDEARRIAKIFLFGDHSEGQLPFAAMARPRQHDDASIGACQGWIAEHYAIANPVAEMSRRSGLAERTFKRRFTLATGYTPIAYVQSLRVEEAKQMLETTDDAIDAIAEQVGYEDAGSFRRLFKSTVGVTPHRYRQRYRLAPGPHANEDSD